LTLKENVFLVFVFLFACVFFLTETVYVFCLNVTLFQNLLKRFSKEGVIHFCTSRSLTAQPEGEQEARNYRAITLNKVTDGNITEACCKWTVTERL